MIRFAHFPITLLVAFALVSCRSAPPAAPKTAEVIYLGRQAPGTMTVESVGYGSDVEQALRHAEESAFEVLLFRGLPGSPQRNALVVPGETDQRTHARYFDDLLRGGRYATFMTESRMQGDPRKTGRLHRVIVAITINENALRKDLERNGIIRSFGL